MAFSLEQCLRILQASGETPELWGELGLAFAPAEIGALSEGVLQIRSLGPGGADGVLPYGWLEWLQQATQDKTAHRRILSLCFNSVLFSITTAA